MKQVNSIELKFYNQLRLYPSGHFKEFMAFHERYASIMKKLRPLYKTKNYSESDKILFENNYLDKELIKSFKKTCLFIELDKREYFAVYNNIKTTKFYPRDSNLFELCLVLSTIIFVQEFYPEPSNTMRKWVANGLIYSILYFMNIFYENNEMINAELDKQRAILN